MFPDVVATELSRWRQALQEHCESKYSVEASAELARREVFLHALAIDEAVMARDNHRTCRWRTSYTMDA